MTDPSVPEAKRRRLQGGATLLRPFKSPLPKTARASNDQSSQLPLEAGIATPKNSPSGTVTGINAAATPSKQSRATSSSSSDANAAAAASAEFRRKRLALQSKLKLFRSELETIQQALQIESSTRDDELKALTKKWRRISQKAAEELLEAARDKVERMGGVRVWRENERQRIKRAQMWEDDDFYNGGEREAEAGTEGEGANRDAKEDARSVYVRNRHGDEYDDHDLGDSRLDKQNDNDEEEVRLEFHCYLIVHSLVMRLTLGKSRCLPWR